MKNENVNKRARMRERLSKSTEFEEVEECCPNPNAVERNGVLVCTNCGCVLGKQIVGYLKRAFSVEEMNKRKNTEKKWRSIGARTIIGRKHIDSRGRKLDATRKTKFNRLDKIQKSLIGSLERNIWEAKPKLNALASKLNLPKFVKETAWRIYLESAKKKLTMGRSIIAFIAASAYAAIRIHELPRMFDEVCDSELVQRRNAHQALGLLIKEVLPVLNLSYKPITAKQLVFRYGNDLELPLSVQRAAFKLIETAHKNGLNSVGKDPRGLAASSLYIIARNAKDSSHKRTQVDIASKAKITEVTLRSRVKDLRKYSANSL